ncbi:hypothetical protein DNTS_002554 [Danionella cerebrum]|uniref:Ciliary associated calcium binding coiled-coil 1 n=1 Tax=Danionella cerebrum TaxID=2873325 RepID=A0A553QAA5_9TELE|nr:hypothetical protein DNTS_002554 [Danionella translucida]
MSVLQWNCLNPEQLKNLLKLPVDQVQLQFEDALSFKKHQTCLKEAALLENFVNAFWWAKEMNFTSQQISFIMALLQLLIDNIKNKHASFAESFTTFSETLLSTRSPPSTKEKSSSFFSNEQIKDIMDYFRISLFQHHRLHELVFSHQREELLVKMEKSIEVINPVDFSAPLEEGFPCDLYYRHMAPSSVQAPEEDPQESQEEVLEEPEAAVLEEGHEGFSVEEVRELLGEMTREMLTNLQADFTEKLRLHEETHLSRIERLQKGSKKH